MKSVRLLLVLPLLLLVTGCTNLKYGWNQELELLRHWDESVDYAQNNRNKPYWDSYSYGWNQEKDHWPALWDCIKRGWNTDWDQILLR